ncbi:MAG: hypothetical protein ACF8PN_10055 [Phycisphaerales bacterium]
MRCTFPRRYAGWIVAAVLATSFGASTVQPRRAVIIEDTLEASLAQPRIHVQIVDGQRILEGEPITIPDIDLEVEGAATSFAAFLDTGASACVLSAETAERFGVELEPDATYYEVGLSGEKAMMVTREYRLLLADASGTLNDRPARFEIIDAKYRFLVNETAGGAASAVAGMMGGIDIVGVPAFRDSIVEIDPTPLQRGADALKTGSVDDALDSLLAGGENLSVGPIVRLHDRRRAPKRRPDLEIPLELVDYNRRRHPGNRGPLPDLGPNPVILDAESERQGHSFKGDWLLDTGAAASIISRDHARKLGLLDANGDPLAPVAFQLPIGGVSGQAETLSGFVIDRLRIPTKDRRVVEFRDAHVLVKDIGIKLDDGSYKVLDGVFGLNLLMPSVSGISAGWPSDMTAGPFERIWVNMPGRTLELELRH